MALSKKFWFAFGLIAIFAIGLTAYGFRALSNTADLVSHLYDESVTAVNYSRTASTTMSEARSLMAQSLLPGNVVSPAAADSLRRTRIAIAEDLRAVRQRVHDPGVGESVDRAETSIADFFDGVGMTQALPLGEVAITPSMPPSVERQSAVATARLDYLVDQVAASGLAFRARAQAEIGASSVALAALSGGIIVMSALTALLFSRWLIRPIQVATRIAEDVAAGNTTNIVITTRRDEIGQLLASLATMQSFLRGRDAQALVLLQAKEQAAETLLQTNLRFDAALNNMSHGLLMCDADARVVVINRQFCEVAGIDPSCIQPNANYRDVLALSVAAGNHQGRTVDDVFAEQMEMFRARRPVTVTRTTARGRIVEIAGEPLPDGGWIATQMDVTERRRSEEQIIFLARHDALTQLPNRVLFQERLNQALAKSERGEGFALLYLDLDRFKAVNDTLGHPIGDGVLRTVANRLQAVVRDIDTIARLGGDEFAILQSGATTPVEASLLACRIIEVVSQPYQIEGHQLLIGVSIGVAMAPGDSANPVELVKHADLALYRAKQDGRDTWRFFEPAMDALAKARGELERDLRNALSLEQFELYYQPMVSSRGLHLTGFEVLLRWHHPKQGLIAPVEFISIAEEIGLIGPIGAWVLDQACATAATWPDHLTVAVNLSPLQFRGQTLLHAVTDALRTSGILAERLEFEITESVPTQNDQATRSTLHTLRTLGARIVLDDFGTGLSSLSHLRSFPFDSIKIDGSFVRGLGTREDSSSIVRAIVSLGNSLHMHTTAEGVETEAQFDFLAAVGCVGIQGFLISDPVPASALPDLIGRLSPRAVTRGFGSGSNAATPDETIGDMAQHTLQTSLSAS